MTDKYEKHLLKYIEWSTENQVMSTSRNNDFNRIKIIMAMLLLVIPFEMCSCKKNDNVVATGGDIVVEHVAEGVNSVSDEETVNIGTLEEEITNEEAGPTQEQIELTQKYKNIQAGTLYTEPMLMNPQDNSVEVVWFTENEGSDNEVIIYSADREYVVRVVSAVTDKLTRTRGGKDDDSKNDPSIKRDIYRHSAVVDELPVNDGSVDSIVTYSVRTDEVKSSQYVLKARAQEGVAQKILITSDHQNKKMCAANIQKAYETVPDIDAVFVDGDMADVADRAYDWFDSDNSFFKVMQGTANHEIGGKVYNGAPILQNAPIYTSIGNHEVMGVYSDTRPLDEQFNNPTTREYAARLYEAQGGDDEESFITDHSFNTITYDEIFGNDRNAEGEGHYYSFSIGDTRVIVLEMARIWRLATIGFPGKYSEIPGMGEDTYGYGQFIFEPISEGSRQYDFLKRELASKEFQDARYKIVMYHFDSHSLGSNCIPAYTEPVAHNAVSPITGQSMVVYDYPVENDYIANLVEPLMEKYNVDLLITGHSHIWNRFITKNGMNILESSNVGNNYGGYYKEGDARTFAPSAFNRDDGFYSIRSKWNADNYAMRGDPLGLEPEYPSEAELPDGLPYLASDTVTAFSILDTGRGVVDSYYYDTQDADSEAVLFDSFPINRIK